MHIPQHNNRTNQIGFIQLALIIGAASLFIAVFTSCNAEKKVLKPYKAVNSDVDTSFKEKKKELISRVCAVNFPIQEKTIIKDSIRTKLVKVQDNTLINKLKAQLAKGCPTINIDSIYNELPTDTLYVEKWRIKEVTQKDTQTLYNMAKTNDELHSKVNTLEADKTSLNKHIEDITSDLNKANKWKLYFFLLLFAGVAYKVAKIYLSTKFTLHKIL